MIKKIYLILLLLIILYGCAKPEIQYITKYKEIKVPIKCDINMPNKPKYDESKKISILLTEILYYTKQLEISLRYCVGENNETKRINE